MEVFLVAYTCFNLNLKIFAEARSNRQRALYVNSPLLKTPLRKEDSVMNLLCCEVKTIFALKFNSE
jgi:hypothetical protein